MGKISDLNVRLGLITAGFDKQLAGVQARLRRSSQQMSDLANNMSLSLSAPLAAFGYSALQAAGDIEALQLALETTMKDAGRTVGEAKAELDELRKAALAPGLDFEQAVKGSVRLQNVGYRAEEAREILVQLANAVAMSGGSAQELDGVTRQFGQMISKGRILQEDLTIIQENMPSITKAMNDAFGTASAEKLREMGVNAQEFVAGVTKQLALLPRVEGGIKNTLVNLRVEFTSFLAGVGTEIDKAFNLKKVADDIGKNLRGALEWFQKLDDGTKRTIVQFGLVVIAAGPVLKVFSALQGVAGQAISVFRAFNSGIAPAINLLSGLTTSTQTLTGYFGNMASGMLGAGNAALRMRVAFIAATGGLAAIVLGIAAAAYLMADRFDAAKFATDQFNDAKKTTIEQAAKETAALNQNFDVLRSVTSTTNERKRAIQTLQNTYPDYLKNIDLEKASNEELTRIQKGLNDEILRGVAERQKAAAVTAIYEKQAAILLRIQQIRSGDKITTGEAALIDTGDLIRTGSRAAAVLEELQKQVDDLRSEAQKAGRDFDAAFGLSSGVAGLLDSTATGRDLYEQLRDEYSVTAKEAKKAAVATSDLGSATTAAAGPSKKMKTALAGVGAELKAFDENVKLYGPTAEDAEKRSDLLAKAIDRLLKAGFSSTSEQVTALKNELDKSNVVTEDARRRYEELRESWSKPINVDIPEPAVPTIPGLSVPGLDFSTFGSAAEQTKELARVTADASDVLTSKMQTALTGVNSKIQAYNESIELYGPSAISAAERTDVLRASIEKLLGAGFDSASDQVQQLKTALDGATSFNLSPTTIQAATEGIKSLTVATQESIVTAMTPMQAIMQGLQQGFLTTGEAFTQLSEIVRNEGSAMQNMMLDIGNAIAESFDAGATTITGFAKNMLQAAARIIKTYIQMGVTRAVFSALQNTPFPLNLAIAPIAGGAAAALFSAAIGKIGIPKLAGGGVLDRPTLALLGEYAGAKSNPEIAAPESMLRDIFREENAGGAQELYSVIRGEDLLLITDKAQARRGRIR